jgi:dipeptidyl aminopeptidase/acylaminoacyl peptidase
VGGIREEDLVEPLSVFYESFDGEKIHAFLYLPKGAKRDGSLPCILYPHGGPEAQMYNTFYSEFQFFAKNGYAIIIPHFRGSMGFGKKFQKLIYRDWGGGDLQDMLYAVKFVVKEGYCDARRISIYGASYGGYATLIGLVKAPDVFACGVDVFGPSNLFTFYESNPPSWKPFVEAILGNPVENRAFFEDRSPIFHIDKIKAPLLIMQGANDPRVVDEESEQIFEALKAKGLDVEYLWFEDEGHGFTKKENRLLSMVVMLDFLNKHLK